MGKASEKKILVVDDEPDIRNFLTTCIQDAGFMVDSAVDGQDALEKLEKEIPDLMTLDMVMPRKSGIELIRTLRKNEKWSKLPVIVITAHARNEFASEDIKSFNAFTSGLKPRRTIEKPVTPKVLLNTICQILDVEPETVTAEDEELLSDQENLVKMIQNSDSTVLKQIKSLLGTD
ncbi:MAG: response regulator [Desulfobacula sp.]|jgi:CheY-like chemotaxis protein|uniref:response regulator n=1 Tax=Desulfobacula sp. TaxID=2593537 RepID=UPI001DE4E508|nr:response regulator [Desulfobacula sp.]MBT3484905.1 response regulator [Desulfobacula sp.]MBT3803259.1 response regulator [Desulfobacula sp.]MBT4024642.1 response regulator [Desulfobacula sp.]MBT4200408.1 response regulator [Desulfobacula sp.]